MLPGAGLWQAGPVSYTPEQMTAASAVRLLRFFYDLHARDIAASAGVTAYDLSRFENGHRPLSDEQIRAVFVAIARLREGQSAPGNGSNANGGNGTKVPAKAMTRG